jgi:hypothetical protein
LQGALVVEVKSGDESPRLLVDSLHSPHTSACVVERLHKYAKKAGTLPTDISLKANLIFRLEEAPGL